MARYKLYDTRAKREAFLKRPGNIVTFKKGYYFDFVRHTQVLIERLETNGKQVRIIGFTKLTPWFKSMAQLIKAVDWEQMERWHS